MSEPVPTATPPAAVEPGVAIVTGAGGGIGRAIVADFISAGYTVAACDLNIDAANSALTQATEAMAAQSNAGSPSGSAYRMDVSDSDQVRAVIAQVEDELGPVQVLVNNAGIDKIEPFV